ncbi:MAG: YhcH/YjgK/YiaL family protein [Mariprofundales bacterium]
MIVDTIRRCDTYRFDNRNILVGLRWLRDHDLNILTLGKHEIDGDRIFFLVNEYETRVVSDGDLEAHRKYIDIHCMVSGSEQMGYAPPCDCKPVKEYDDEQDYALYHVENTRVRLDVGMFALFFPGELHLPGVDERVSSVKKIVVKVKV